MTPHTPKRIIAITGVSSGLGRALVERWCTEGHRVFGCARNAGAIADLNTSFGDTFRVVDVCEEAAVRKWAEEVAGTSGAPDLLVNNAAIINRPAPLWEVPSEEFQQLIDINIVGVRNVIAAFVPGMIAARRGVIVNLSSGWGRSTSPEVAPYCASKYAIEGLSSALAQELPPGLACCAVSPGIIDTPMLRRCWGDGAAQFSGPEDWASRAGPFLLSLGPGDNGGSLTTP